MIAGEASAMSADLDHPVLSNRPLPKKGKVVSAIEAVSLIRDGDTVATGGFVGIGFAEEITIALEELFLSTGETQRAARALCRPKRLFPTRTSRRDNLHGKQDHPNWP